MDLHHLALRTRDLDSLVAFYRDLLGLAELRGDGQRSVWLSVPPGVLMIERAEPEEPSIPAGSLELFALRVTDEEKGRLEQRLRDAGVAIEARTEHTLYVRDPDGRRIGLSSHPLTAGGSDRG